MAPGSEMEKRLVTGIIFLDTKGSFVYYVKLGYRSLHFMLLCFCACVKNDF